MDTTVRATCPQCQTVLRIPSQWVGQAVKCKKCGTVVRSRPKGGDAGGSIPQNGVAAGADPAAFDFSQSSGEDDGFPFQNEASPADEADDRFDPTGGADESEQPAPPPPAQAPAAGMPPGYPYPMPPGYPQPGGAPPGYPQPGAYGAPPGYPYAPPPGAPPGYPYPMPPGYPQPGGAPPGYPQPGAYGAPPGYPYPMPPGYPQPGGAPPGYPQPGGAPPGYPQPGAYGAPPGYPYAPPPGAPAPGMPGAMGTPPAPAAPAYPQQQAAPIAPAPSAPPTPKIAPPPSPATGRLPRMPAPAPAVQPSPSGPAKSGAPAKPATNGQPAAQGAKPPTAAVPKQQAQGLPNPAFKTGGTGIVSAPRAKKNGGPAKMIWVGVCLVLTAGIVAGAIYGARHISNTAAKKGKEGGQEGKGEQVGPAPVAAKTGAWPRRMLFIHISKYMFLNPLTAGQNGGEDRTAGSAIRLANEWNVPFDPRDNDRNQLYILSDTARPQNPKMMDTQNPMKSVVTGAYEQFFATSRAQDRIVMYFGGHALEKDGKAYIAPIEGDLDDPEPTLIPLSDVYDKLKVCRATQRVVIWDVCRYNPQRGRQRPGSEPMSETLYAALKAAPPGVETIITCQPGENALEFFNLQIDAGATANAAKYAGSAFLESMKYVASKNTRQAGKQPTPGDPIPVTDWSNAVAKRVSDMATSPIVGLKQTMKLEGKAPAAFAPYNPDEPIAKRFEFPQPPKGTSPAEVAAIVNEFNVPSIKLDLIDAGLGALPFRDEVMKDYKSDVSVDTILKDKETYKFQAKTLEVFQKIREMWTVTTGASGGAQIRDDFKAPVDDKLKNEIKKEQDFWAIGVAELELLNAEIDSLMPMREGQSKRWQAHYDYARATLKARLAFMNEYNKLMGDVLTETLPALDPKLGQDRYKLVSSEKLKSKKDIQAIAAEAKEAYDKVIADHKATPWAIQAKRDKAFALGLNWQPISSGTTTE